MRYTAERPNYRPDVETAPLAQVGRRVGATALGLALVVPAVLPDFDPSGLGFGSGGFGSGSGGNEVSVVNPILDLGRNLRRSEDRVVLRYRGRPTYLRIVGLDEFDGRRGGPASCRSRARRTTSRTGSATHRASVATWSGPRRRYGIDVFQLDQTWLPLPYPTKRVSIDGTWLYDEETFNVFGENASTLDLSYDLRALDVRPTPEQLRDAGEAPDSLGRYLQLPTDLPRRRGRGDPGSSRRQHQRLRPGDGPAGVAAERVHVRHRGRGHCRRRQRLGGCLRLPGHPRGLLRALRVDDGGDGPAAGHPRPGGGRLHRRDLGRLGEPVGRVARPARLAGALLRGRRLDGLRADARRAHRRPAAVGPAAVRRGPGRGADTGSESVPRHRRHPAAAAP